VILRTKKTLIETICMCLVCIAQEPAILWPPLPLLSTPIWLPACCIVHNSGKHIWSTYRLMWKMHASSYMHSWVEWIEYFIIAFYIFWMCMDGRFFQIHSHVVMHVMLVTNFISKLSAKHLAIT